MKDRGKTKEQLMNELAELCQRITKLEASEAERKQAEEALRQSEEKLETILENTSDIIFQLSPLGTIQYVSPRAIELYGYKAEDLIGRHLRTTTPARELPKALKVLKSVLSGKVISNFEINQLDANGRIVPVEINATPVRKDGKIIAVQGVMRDITQRKEAQDRIKRAAEEWRTTFDSIADLVSIHDKDFRLIRVNKAFADALKMKPKEVVGKTCYQVLHGTNEPVPSCPHMKTLKTKEPAVGDFFEPHLGIHLEIATSPIFNEKGEAVASVHVARDITEHKLAEEKLRQTEEYFRSLIENALDAIVIINRDGTIRYRSPSQERILGYKAEEQTSNIFECVHPDDIPEITAAYAQLVGNPGGTLQAEVRVHHKDGSWIYIEAQGHNLLDNPSVAGIVVNLRDITERKRLQRKVVEYKELNKVKSSLLSTVSHEFCAPLATIKGYSNLLLDHDKRLRRDEKGEYLEAIDRATDRLTELVDSLLDMSRLEAGLLHLQKEPTSISRLMKDAVAEAKLRAPSHEIVLKLPKRLPRLEIDVRRIRQVLDNIVDNAIKYSEEGTRVVIEACLMGSELQVSVADQGMGISAEDLKRVFDRMYRIEQRLTSDIKGAGLGLAICKGLVKAHGGRIWAESKVGRGSTFYFTLPLDTE